MADTPVNPIAGSMVVSGTTPAVTKWQFGVELWLVVVSPEFSISPVADIVPITVRG